MNIKKMINGEILTLYVAGRIDTTNAKEFEDVINSELKDITGLIMDFAELEYISSAGLRVLLIAIKQMKKQGSMKIVHSNEMVKESFEVTGFADLVEVE